MTQLRSEWSTGPSAWAEFVDRHPELGYRPGRWPFHNFLRYFRHALVRADAIRLAKGRFWIAHRVRFNDAAFACASGQSASVTAPQLAPGRRAAGDLPAAGCSRTTRGRQQRPPDRTPPTGRSPPPATDTPTRVARRRRPSSRPTATTSPKNRSHKDDR